MYRSERRVQGKHGKQTINNTDTYGVFIFIKNTQTYYRQNKYDNFGPLQVFWTISCADIRWRSNLTGALRELDSDWEAEFTLHTGVGQYQEVEIIISFTEEGQRKSKPIHIFLRENVSESKHEIIRKNVVTATRIFDHRMKPFEIRVHDWKRISNASGILLIQSRIPAERTRPCTWSGVEWCTARKKTTSSGKKKKRG